MSETRTKYRTRTDANHRAIAAYLRAKGCLVFSLHIVGKGLPDLLVRLPNGTLTLIEIKTAKGHLTPAQRDFIGSGWPVTVVRSESDCDRLLG